MNLETRLIAEAHNTILVHNVAYPSGRTAVRKGTRLTQAHIATLAELGHNTVQVAVLADTDVFENEAALALAQALQHDYIGFSQPAGGRIDLISEALGLLEIDTEPLFELNMIPSITLATRPQHTVVGPDAQRRKIATLKIIPYAVPQAELDAALHLVQSQPNLLCVRSWTAGCRVALVLTGEPAVHDKLRADFVPPTRQRLARLSATLMTIEPVNQSVSDIRNAVMRLSITHDMLIIAGQTSIMAIDDTTPQALVAAGAVISAYGAPVEPGNLLTLAYLSDLPILCAPGCARSPAQNIVDMVLPRLLLGDRLNRRDIAAYGLGGLIK